MFKNIQPAIKDETKRLAIAMAVFLVLEVLVFFLLNLFFADKVPFDYTVVLGGIGGGIVAVLNFFLMGMTIQSVLEVSDQDLVKKQIGASYRNRILLQVLWIIAAILAPCFQTVAGILPLLLPGIWFKIRGFQEDFEENKDN